MYTVCIRAYVFVYVRVQWCACARVCTSVRVRRCMFARTFARVRVCVFAWAYLGGRSPPPPPPPPPPPIPPLPHNGHQQKNVTRDTRHHNIVVFITQQQWKNVNDTIADCKMKNYIYAHACPCESAGVCPCVCFPACLLTLVRRVEGNLHTTPARTRFCFLQRFRIDTMSLLFVRKAMIAGVRIWKNKINKIIVSDTCP